MDTKCLCASYGANQGSRRARQGWIAIRLLAVAMFAGAATMIASAHEQPLATAEQREPGTAAESVPAAIPDRPLISSDEAPVGGVDALARALLLDNLPREYENTKHWGQTKPRWDGLNISVDGWQIKTKRRWKDVQHGTWTQYRAWLIEPERELQIRFHDPRPAGSHRAAFDLTVDARLGATGRVSEWNRACSCTVFTPTPKEAFDCT